MFISQQTLTRTEHEGPTAGMRTKNIESQTEEFERYMPPLSSMLAVTAISLPSRIVFSPSSLSELRVDIMVGTATMPSASPAMGPRCGAARGVPLGDAALLAPFSPALLPITLGPGAFDPLLAEGLTARSSGASMSKVCSPSLSLCSRLFGSSSSSVSSVPGMRNGLVFASPYADVAWDSVLSLTLKRMDVPRARGVASPYADVVFWESVLSLRLKGMAVPWALSRVFFLPSVVVEPLPERCIADVRDLSRLLDVPSRLIFLTLSLSLVRCSFSLVLVCSTMLMMSARLATVWLRTLTSSSSCDFIICC
ncbi:unnamed protein product [Prorocentrum cordatum]|uniref:Uncharacterized protein n=1 Tax=Prorocentrum cordatum TaxID=2364126 RepID=A0ABN9PFX8_9DINO|nr:unnamed protein product [Polarella glacialis]